jgi:hypothetical protein
MNKATAKRDHVQSRIIIQREKKWKNWSSRSVGDQAIDCGDKECVLEYRVMPDCYLFLETNNTNCQIPCKLEGCETELHHFISCPVWLCEPTTTSTPKTTSSTTSSTSTTQKPRPIDPSKHMSPLIYVSIVLNILLVGLVMAFVVVKVRTWITTQITRFRNRNQTTDPEDRHPNPNRFFSNPGRESNDSSDHESDPLIASTNSLVNLNVGSTNSLANLNVGTNAGVVNQGFQRYQNIFQNVDLISPDPDVSRPESEIQASDTVTEPTTTTAALLLNEPQSTVSVDKPFFLRMTKFGKKK